MQLFKFKPMSSDGSRCPRTPKGRKAETTSPLPAFRVGFSLPEALGLEDHLFVTFWLKTITFGSHKALVYSMPKGGKKLLTEVRLTKDRLFFAARSRQRILSLPPAGGFIIMPACKEGTHLPYYAASAVGLIRAMQQAILVQRQLDLAALEQVAGGAGGELKRNPESLTLRDEVEAFALAIDEVKKKGEAGEALEVWVRLILYCNQNQINAVRLRIVEFLTALTRGGGTPCGVRQFYSDS